MACVFGLLGATAKLSKSRAARWSAEVYTTLIRGMPELVLMLLIFYGGQIGINRLADAQGWGYIDIPPFLAGVLTIGFIFGAYLNRDLSRCDSGGAAGSGRGRAGICPVTSHGDVAHCAAADGAPRHCQALPTTG